MVPELCHPVAFNLEAVYDSFAADARALSSSVLKPEVTNGRVMKNTKDEIRRFVETDNRKYGVYDAGINPWTAEVKKKDPDCWLEMPNLV